MNWTDERVRLLKLWWADGDSAGTIAKRFDTTTRNAVIGKIHRLKLTRHPLPIGHKRLPRATKPHVRKGRQYHPGGAIFKAPPIKKPVLRKEIIFTEALMISLMELDEHKCKWPCGEGTGEKQLFCGTPKEIENSYCNHHFRLAYQPASVRPRPQQSIGWQR